MSVGVAICCACSSSVQDLGENVDPRTAETEDPAAHDEHQGFGAEWACPDSLLGRDLACPLTRPAEGDACGSRNSAPCAFIDVASSAFEAPELDALPPATTFCMCTRELRWACLHSVVMRTLATPLVDGDPCEDSLSVDSAGVHCTCERGRARCVR